MNKYMQSWILGILYYFFHSLFLLSVITYTGQGPDGSAAYPGNIGHELGIDATPNKTLPKFKVAL